MIWLKFAFSIIYKAMSVLVTLISQALEVIYDPSYLYHRILVSVHCTMHTTVNLDIWVIYYKRLCLFIYRGHS